MMGMKNHTGAKAGIAHSPEGRGGRWKGLLLQSKENKNKTETRKPHI